MRKVIDTTNQNRYNRSNEREKGNKMIIVRTETWNTKQGKKVKAVIRDEKGKLIGASNQTKAVDVGITKAVDVGIIGK